MPKQYGSPTGTEKPKDKGRTKPQPGSAKSYIDHMVEAHNSYQKSTGATQKAAPEKPPAGRGGSTMGRDVLGIGKPKSIRRVDDAVDDAGG
jgi:hypothetical protein